MINNKGGSEGIIGRGGDSQYHPPSLRYVDSTPLLTGLGSSFRGLRPIGVPPSIYPSLWRGGRVIGPSMIGFEIAFWRQIEEGAVSSPGFRYSGGSRTISIGGWRILGCRG